MSSPGSDNRGQPLLEVDGIMGRGDSGDLLEPLLAHLDSVGGDDQLALAGSVQHGAILHANLIAQVRLEDDGGLGDEGGGDLGHGVVSLYEHQYSNQIGMSTGYFYLDISISPIILINIGDDMAKKKTTKKKIDKAETHDKPAMSWADIEKTMYNDDNNDFAWSVENLDPICDFLQKLACHMVWTGLEMQGQPEEMRLRVLDEIMETKRYQLSEEEMHTQMPYDTIKEQLLKFSTKLEEGVYTVGEEAFSVLCNKLAELAVYKVMQDLEKQGYLTLAWDDTKNDFVYKPGPKSVEGEEWRRQ